MSKKPQHMLDKLVEQSASTVLSFVLSTALLGGSGYLLFQLPEERQIFSRAALEFRKSSAELSASRDMYKVYSDFEIERIGDIYKEFTRNIPTQQPLNPTFVSESLSWISDTLDQFERQRHV
jgi:hypothetical protein